MDKYKLKLEVTNTKYKTNTAQEIYDAIHLKNITVKVPISVHDVKQYMMLKSVWLPIKTSADDIAVLAMDALEEFEQFDVRNPDILITLTGILDGLVIAIPEFLDVPHKQDVLAMGDKKISIVERDNIGTFGIGKVMEAMR